MTPEIIRASRAEYGPASHARHRKQFMLSNQHATAAKLAQEWRDEATMRTAWIEIDNTRWAISQMLEVMKDIAVLSLDVPAPEVELCGPVAEEAT
jgi:hypothetical protein